MRPLAYLLLLWTAIAHAVPLFNTVTLDEFGTVANYNLPLSNLNPTFDMQAINLFSKPVSPDNPFVLQPPRTNDFQVLQQNAASSREVVRVNQFYVSQGPEGVGLTFPISQDDSTAAITTPTADFQIIFGASESQELVRTSNLSSSQMMTVTYALPQEGADPPPSAAPAETPTVVPAQLFQLFECTAPVIHTRGPKIESLTIDGEAVSLLAPFPTGRQFVFTLETGQIYYIDVTKSALPIRFVLENDRTTLRALIPFTGFLRYACVEGSLSTDTFNEFQRNNVSPFLQANDATIEQIFIDGVEINPTIFIPPTDTSPFGPLPAGRNFRLILSNDEIWRIDTDPLLPPVLFVLSQDRTIFRSTIFYEGLLNFGCVDGDVELTDNEELSVETTAITFVPPVVITESRTPEETILDYNIIGNAYHDIEYNQLTPQLTFVGNATLQRLIIDDLEQNLNSPEPFPPGFKFKFEFEEILSNGAIARQSWLIYVEQSYTPPFPGNAPGQLGAFLPLQPIQFNFGDDATSFIASNTFTGILRVAAIQITPIPDATPPVIAPTVGDTWATSAVTQTNPATPIAMYLLWPTDWTALVSTQLTTFIPRSFEVPACSRITELLPVLALNDFTRARAYFNQITASEYFTNGNPFITFFLMLMARELSADIAAYQATFRPTPVYGIVPTEAETEAAYDAHRSIIPIASDIIFETGLLGIDGYRWNYTCIDGAENPLILFPAYKLINFFLHLPITGFGYVDAIKGLLLGVEAVDCQVGFLEGPVPAWYTTDFYIPSFFVIPGFESSLLQGLFWDLPTPVVTSAQVADVGEELFEFALIATFAVFMFDQIPGLAAFIPSFTEPYIDVIKSTLDQYLFTHINATTGTILTDFFIGDKTTPGVCASSGMFAQSEGVVTSRDGGNAIYNLHHQQYGFWLNAVAMMMQWDNRFNPTDPWIAQRVTLSDGSVVKRKDFVDMLWRDARNVDKDDPDQLPFNRHGNPWEGHSTSNGILYTPLAEGRFQESWAKDFNSWVGVNQYARAVLTTPMLDAADTTGFARLAAFAQINMQLTATSGKLVYQDSSWIYGPPYNVNVTVGQVYDTQTLAETDLDSGSPPCVLFTPN